MKVLNKPIIRRSVSVVALLMLVLTAQISSLEHSVEHVFHGSHELCKSFIHFEKSASALHVIGNTVVVFESFYYDAITASGYFKYTQYLYSIRAPPSINILV